MRSQACLLLRDGSGEVVGLLKILRDISFRLGEQQALADAKERLELALDAGAVVGTWLWRAAGNLLTVDARLARLIGIDPGRAANGVLPDTVTRLVAPDSRPALAAALVAARRTGEPFRVELRLQPGAAPPWAEASGRMELGAGGRPIRSSGVLVDITDRKRAEAALHGETERLDALNRVGTALVRELDLETLIQTATDAATALAGAAFGAFFYNLRNADDRVYQLYTLSGTSRAAFADVPMPRDTAVFGPTFRGEGVVRSGDITQDPRFGLNTPFHGMPKGHLPVRSYLAVPVMARSGEVLGGMLFGHPEPDRFTAQHERLLVGVAAQAAVAIDNARLFQAAQHEIAERRRAEDAMRELNETLEQRVAERTAQIAAANAQLQAEIGERERAEHSARDSEQRFKLLVEGVTDHAIYMLDPEGRVTNWNAGAERIMGYAAAEIIGDHYSRFYTEEDRRAGEPKMALATAELEGRYEREAWRLPKDGRPFRASVVIDPIWARDGKLVGYAKVTRDITERRNATLALEQAREQLFQSQKMEAVGQLTGGLAHDFNNLLAGIIGNLELMELRIGQGQTAELGRYVAAARGAADRAAALTHRLLAFGRRQTLDSKPTDANRLVAGLEELIQRTVGPAIALDTALADGLWPVLCDPNQLENALLNLAINARDAMPQGGRLSISTANAALDAREPGPIPTAAAPAPDGADPARRRDTVRGQYVRLSVTDTGTGMTPEVMGRALDPFFTTKPTGQGTGLGLSMIHGFVSQSGGQVRLHSAPGQGTTVELTLPRSLHPAVEAGVPPGQAGAVPQAQAGETVLVVDDEPAVRALVMEVLDGLGYAAVEAADAATGLAALRTGTRVDLLVTDVGLPGGMNGRQLADKARAVRPGLGVLFITGYAEEAVLGDARLDGGMQVMTKPFTLDALAARIRTMIGEGPHRPDGSDAGPAGR